MQGLIPRSRTLLAVLLLDGLIFDVMDCLDKSLIAVPNYVEIEQPGSYYSSKVDEVSFVPVLHVSGVISGSYVEKWRCLTSATFLDKERTIMRVMINEGYEPTYIEGSIGVCKFPQLDELLHVKVGGECIGGVFCMLFLLDLVMTPTWTREIIKLGANSNSKELKRTFNRLIMDLVINLLLIVYMAVIVCRNSSKLCLEHTKQVKVLSPQVSHKKSSCQQGISYLTEPKINQDVVTCDNIMRYWFNRKLFSWITMHKLKKVIRNAEQLIEKSCMEYQVGTTLIKFAFSFLRETHELKLTLVKLKLMEIISVFEMASDNEEQGTQYSKSYSGVDQSMKLGSHFGKWHQTNVAALLGSQCVLDNKAAATIVGSCVITLAKQEEPTWVLGVLLLVDISLEKHEDMLYFKGCGLLGSYIHETLY
ncbi:hypothetical protein M0R45_005669 [Rubus argutus]|uniref:Uncharacterized protein n=1 Tax=Rubus argutus TaxID=59490 RepID=A0AAW1YNF4_RUBAR